MDLVGYDATAAKEQGADGFTYFFVIDDPTIVGTNAKSLGGISGTGASMFLQSQNIPNAQRYGFNGNSFKLKPKDQNVKGRQTTVHIYHARTGAFNELTIINNIIKKPNALLSGFIKE